MGQTLEYPYRIKAWKILFMMLFYGVSAVVVAGVATRNGQGLDVEGLFQFSPESAAIVYWVFAAIFAAATVGAAVVLVTSRSHPKLIRLTDSEFSAPKSLFARTPTVLRFPQITGVEILVIQRQRFLTVKSSAGKVTIPEAALPSPAALDELRSALAARITIR